MTKIAVIGIVGESVFLEVDAFGQTGETAVARALHNELGGKGYNQAVAAARYGAAVSFLGAVYKGDASRFSEISSEKGIAPFLVPKEEGSPYAVITTDKKGDNRVLVYRGATLSAEDVDAFAEEIASADLLLISNEVPEEVNERAVSIAKENGVFVLLNPAPLRESRKEFLEKIDLFTPNEFEEKGLESFENVIVTLGARGCFIKPLQLHLPSVPVKTVLDTTGAGDTFSGVLAVALAEGEGLKSACQKASVAAAIKVSRRYVLDSVPTRKEIENYKEE